MQYEINVKCSGINHEEGLKISIGEWGQDKLFMFKPNNYKDNYICIDRKSAEEIIEFLTGHLEDDSFI